jgi:hypothetical protein
VNLQNGPLDKGLLALIVPLIVLPPWIWMAVRTQHCLQIITVHSIPFTKRTVWLVKTLALIVGRRRALRSWSKLAFRGFSLLCREDHRIFRAQRERTRSCATQAQPRRSGLSNIMGNLSHPSQGFPALLEVVRRFIPDVDFSYRFR